MPPVVVDFSIRHAELANAVVRHQHAVITSSYVAVVAGGYLKVDFTADAEEAATETTLRVTLLGAVVRMDLELNSAVVAKGIALPENVDSAGAREYLVSLPAGALVPGVNVLEIRHTGTSDDGDGLLRVRTLTLEPGAGASSSERDLLARRGAQASWTFATERRTLESPTWQPGPSLLLHLETETGGVATRLSWRTTDGAESSVAFRSDLSGFHGHYRAANGDIGELRGTLTERQPDGVGGLFFATEVEHDGVWQPEGRLSLMLVDGGDAAVERVTWNDRRGEATSLVLRTEVTGLSGPVTAGDRKDLEVSSVRASAEFSEWGEVADNLLRSGNKWLAHRNGADLEFTLGAAAVVTAYRLTSGNDFTERDPSDWVLEGSHDGITWTLLDSRTDERFGRREEILEFEFANSASYLHYRLRITRNRGGHETQLSRVEFLGVEGAGATEQRGVCDFVGYRQLPGQEPVGYRGTLVPVPVTGASADSEPVSDSEQLLAGDFAGTAQRLQDAAELLDRLTRYLRP
nr:hypothetical protein [uncultured organism]